MRKANETIELPKHTQHAYYFNNGYGASVVRTPGSYGYSKNLWELAVLKEMPARVWGLCFDTPLTNDFIGGLSEKAVDVLLEEIESWPKRDAE